MQQRFKIETSRIAISCCFAIVIGSLTGCLPQDEVVRYRIPKSRSGLESLRASSQQNTNPAEATDRMIVGLYELPEATWFFKINGSIEQVQKTEAQWRPFLQSLKFDAGQPKWELPEGWSEAAERPMRFATLLIGDEKPQLEMAISSLGPNQELVLNVNRWRDQMGLPAISEAELDVCLSQLDVESGSAWLFDVKGTKPVLMAPFANRPSANSAPSVSQSFAPAVEDAQAGAEIPVEFEPLDGWETGPTSAMVPVRLKKTAGEKTAQITIIQLPAQANEWEPNVARWAGELGLSGLNADELNSRTSEIEVGSSKGRLLRLIENENDRATIGGMIKRGEIAWFIKLTGDQEIVAENEAAFMEWMQSIRFSK